MKALSLIKSGNFTTSLNSWKAMPKASKTPEGYSLVVDGATVASPNIAITGGGTFPVYTYLSLNGEVTWFAGSFEAGSAVAVIAPIAPIAAPVAQVVVEIPAPVAAPKKRIRK